MSAELGALDASATRVSSEYASALLYDVFRFL